MSGSEEELVAEIGRLKEEKDAVLLVHNYQRGEIQDISDYIGDSFDLSKRAAELSCRVIVFCGVRFMAEAAKILSPDKTVLLPRAEAGCPMADMATVEELREMKLKHPRAKVVCYINTNVDVKAECDVCCTSANALEVVEGMDGDEIIFVPDRNLASWVARFTHKKIIPWDGYCYVHERMTVRDVIESRDSSSDGWVVVHPECRPEVIDLSDDVLGTGGMVVLAKQSDSQRFIIGTEEGLVYRLKKENPKKEFFTLGPPRMCRNMKITRLEDVYLALREERFRIEVEDETARRARKALDRMLEYA